MIKVVNLKSKYVPLEKMLSGRWKVHFGIAPFFVGNENGEQIQTDLYVWYETIFVNKPSFYSLKKFILDTINKDVDEKIISGFIWRDMPIWLSQENQFNYKAAFDLAIQTGGQNLPVTFKFGTTEEPQYHKFENIEELMDFYTSAMKYIDTTLNEGWVKKDSIDWSVYENILND